MTLTQILAESQEQARLQRGRDIRRAEGMLFWTIVSIIIIVSAVFGWMGN